MPYTTKKVGKKTCVYKKDTGEKVGCTDGDITKYLAALHTKTEMINMENRLRSKLRDMIMCEIENTRTEGSVSANKIISDLRDEYSKINKIDPDGPGYKKLIGILDRLAKFDQAMLKKLVDAKIKFVSSLALRRLKKEIAENGLRSKLRQIIREEIDKMNEVKTGKIFKDKDFGDIAIKVESDQAGAFVDIYVNGFHIATIDIENPTGNVNIKQLMKSVKLTNSTALARNPKYKKGSGKFTNKGWVPD